MNCPKCGEKMLEGYYQIKGTIGGYLLRGRSKQDLYLKQTNIMKNAFLEVEK